MKLFNKAIRSFSVILILYAILVFVLIVHVIPFTSLVLAISLITIIALLISIFYSYSIIKPVEKLNEQIEKIAEGDFSELNYSKNPEYRNIFNNLDSIYKKLQKYEAKLSKQKEGFNTIIESIKESIWIQDKKGFITTSNQSFINLVQQRNVKGQYFWNVIREKELYDVSDSVFKKPENRTEEIEMDGKYYLCSTSHSLLTEETVFILYDITDIRQLENIKKDFILNVSHELRTPLTSIKGYLETLEDEIGDEHPSYIEVIKRNTDRLINIVKDLLTLSRLEHDISLEKEDINPDEFLKNINKIFEHRLKEKKLKFRYTIEDKLEKFVADRFKWEQVFINLVDNAIKYTEKGEIKIEVKHEDDKIIFEITDTGNGIAPEHLPRLFERFYTVDKSRSRKMGGTGLGLSIVKHIVNLHEGTIKVESTVGQGTRFVVKLPYTRS